MIISLNGKLVDEKNAKISVLDHALLLGDGIFETLRTFNGKLFKFNEHYDRLKSSAKQIFMNAPVGKSALKKQIEATIKANKLREARIRITVTRGVGEGMSINCKNQSVIIIATEIKNEYFNKGVKAITYKIERNLPEVKSLSYLPNVVAKAEASKKGAFEAILIDNKGYAREGTFSNLFIVNKNNLITPKNNLLKGITRNIVVELSKKIGIDVIEKDIMKKELINADEIFITSSIAGIVPITKIDNKKKKTGEITKKIMKLYLEETRHFCRLIWLNNQKKSG